MLPWKRRECGSEDDQGKDRASWRRRPSPRPARWPRSSPAPGRKGGPTVGADGVGDTFFPLSGNGGYDVSKYHVGIAYEPEHEQDPAGQPDRDRGRGDPARRAEPVRPRLPRAQDRRARACATPATPSTVYGEDDFDRDGQELIVHLDETVPAGTEISDLRPLPRQAQGADRPRRLARGLGQDQRRRDRPGRAARNPGLDPLQRPPDRQGHLRLQLRRPEGLQGGLQRRVPRHADEPRRQPQGVRVAGGPADGDLPRDRDDRQVQDRGGDASRAPRRTHTRPSTRSSTPVRSTRAPRSSTTSTSLFGPYPFDETGAIVDRGAKIGYALETQTRPFYPEPSRRRPRRPRARPPVVRQQISLADWSEIWLNEGFAQWAQWWWDRARRRGVRRRSRRRALRDAGLRRELLEPAAGERAGP